MDHIWKPRNSSMLFESVLMIINFAEKSAAVGRVGNGTQQTKPNRVARSGKFLQPPDGLAKRERPSEQFQRKKKDTSLTSIFCLHVRFLLACLGK